METKLSATMALLFGALTVSAQTDSTATDTTQWWSETQLLNEVVIKSTLPKVRTNANGTKVFVAGTELEKAGTTQDLMKRLPGVKSADDGIEIFGRGTAEVYVNGRKLYDNKELDQIPSDQIASVEIITNPGARYAAETKAVVRIRTKRLTGEGWGFSNRLVGYGMEEGGGGSEKLDVNYRKGGLDLSAMFNYQAEGNAGDCYEYMDTYIDGKLFRQTADEQTNRWWLQMIDTRAQVNYQWGDNHSVGARYGFFRFPKYKVKMYLPSEMTYDGDYLQSSDSRIMLRRPESLHTLNLYYSGKLGQWQVDANLDGVWRDSKSGNDTDEDIRYADGTTGQDKVYTYTHGTSRLYAARLVAERPLLGGNLGIGAEYNHTRRAELNLNPKAADGDSKVDEDIYAAFVEYDHKLFGKLDLKAGLRYEKVTTDYYEYGRLRQNRDYDDFFPSVGLAMPVGNAQLSAHYGMDIARPYFSYLTNDVIYINSYTYQSGNPGLKPTYTRNFSLNFAYKWLSAEASCSRVKDEIQVENIAYDEDDLRVTLFRYSNMPSFNRFVFSLYAQPTLFNTWHPTWGMVVMSNNMKLQTADGSMRKMYHPLATFIWNNTVTLPKKWNVSLDAAVQTTGDYSCYYFDEPSCNVNFRLQRTFLDDRLDAAFSVTDLFESSSAGRMQYSYRNFYRREPCFRTFKLVLTYKFNVAKDKYKGGGSVNKQKQRI